MILSKNKKRTLHNWKQSCSSALTAFQKNKPPQKTFPTEKETVFFPAHGDVDIVVSIVDNAKKTHTPVELAEKFWEYIKQQPLNTTAEDCVLFYECTSKRPEKGSLFADFEACIKKIVSENSERLSGNKDGRALLQDYAQACFQESKLFATGTLLAKGGEKVYHCDDISMKKTVTCRQYTGVKLNLKEAQEHLPALYQFLKKRR